MSYKLIDLISSLKTDWKDIIITVHDEIPKIDEFLSTQYLKYKSDNPILPDPFLIFNAFNHFNFNQLKVIIIGQDPYINIHTINGKELPEAHGLSFSVREGIPIPPSLKNIFIELCDDIGCKMPTSGDLTKWADQGVLLLNSALTVIHKKSNSHADIWKTFTDNIIKYISDNTKDVVFILWGNYAKNKAKLIDKKKHPILMASHPSPLSANRGGWFGNKHFSTCNNILIELKHDPVDWTL